MMSPRKAGSAARIAASVRPHLARGRHLPVGVVGVPRLAEAQREAVALGAVHHVGDGLGGGAEGDRQHARRQRVERAAMAAFCASKARLARVTTSVEPMPAGLSTISQPSSGRPRGLRWRCRWRWLTCAVLRRVLRSALRGRAPPPAAAAPRRSAWRSRARCRARNAGRARISAAPPWPPARAERRAARFSALSCSGGRSLPRPLTKAVMCLRSGEARTSVTVTCSPCELRVAELGAREHGGKGVAHLLGDAQLALGGAGGCVGAGVVVALLGHRVATCGKALRERAKGRGARSRRRAPETTSGGGAGYAAATVSVS